MLRLSRAQLREVDRIAIEEYGLPGIALMENAARYVAQNVGGFYDTIQPQHVAIVCGSGNNAGDGLAVARHLHNWSWKVWVILLRPIEDLRGDAAIMGQIVSRMPIPIRRDFAPLQHSSVIIDAIAGTGLSRPLEGTFAKAVELMNASGQPIAAVDVPSGLDCDTGSPLGEVCIRAARTVTLAAEKLGFANPKSREFTGEIVVGDIGCPREILDRVAGQS